MKLIVGLGNPGNQFKQNYHNAGFIIIDEFSRQNSIEVSKKKFNGVYYKGKINNEDFILAKPLTFMNLSGNFISQISNFFKIEPENILIIHDDKDIKIGTFKYKFSGGHAGQNGVRNVIDQLGTRDFSRLRLGIDNNKISSIRDHVLNNFSSSQHKELINNVEIYDSITFFISNDIKKVMENYNVK